jgi:hypothetical protein
VATEVVTTNREKQGNVMFNYSRQLHIITVRGARRVTSIRVKSPETIGIVVLSISSACISVKVMRCCPAAAAVRTHHRQAYRVRHGHETDTNSTRHPHTYHRHPRCNGQVTISCGQEGTINAIQSASEAGIRCHCIPWLIPA